jgi:hypothetical protein
MKPATLSKHFMIRLIIFLLLAGFGLFYIAKDISSGDVKGHKTQEDLLPDLINQNDLNGTNKIEEAVEKIVNIIPVDVRNNIEQKIDQESSSLEDTKVYNQVKEAIDQATGEISGFPGKQTKEAKKQIIIQVCDDLLEKIENE